MSFGYVYEQIPISIDFESRMSALFDTFLYHQTFSAVKKLSTKMRNFDLGFQNDLKA